MIERQFRAGDRVILRDAKCPVFDGKIGVVQGYDWTIAPAPVLVMLDFWSQANCHFAEAQLVRVTEAACEGCAQRGHLGCNPACPDWPHDLRQE